ncbi:MAG: retropepsin-like aspartic protease [bacterium]|nr:retropepsin-like aspartic protease [bacterium]
MKTFEFYTDKEISPVFGKIWKPYAEVELTKDDEPIPYRMLVDPGADITLIRKLTGEYLGLQIEKEDKIYELSGVTGESISVIIKEIRMRIGNIEFPLRVAWSMIEEVPLLIGRLDVFDRFDVELRQREGKVIFKEVG